jgi:DNA-binding LacI/PurR family transcriptional regulator
MMMPILRRMNALRLTMSSKLVASKANTVYSKLMADAPLPSLRSLALEAQVSPMTISLALRNHPRIPKKTRLRIQRLAKVRGYTPDPRIATLMDHLRTRRPKRLQSTIVALTSMTRLESNRYSDNIQTCARQRAAELGFGFDCLEISPYLKRQGSLNKVLRSRGIEGVLLLPMKEPITLDNLVDWRMISVVATSHSVLSPRFHSVLPDGFSSTLQMCAKLKERGCRRIGLVLSSDMEVRSQHNITSAMLWFNAYEGIEPVVPLITTAGDASGFHSWLAHERPDAIISQTNDARSFLSWLGVNTRTKLPRFQFAGFSLGSEDRAAGMLQREEEIGRTAVDLLSGMLQHGERGVPTYPKLTLIPGLWKDLD